MNSVKYLVIDDVIRRSFGKMYLRDYNINNEMNGEEIIDGSNISELDILTLARKNYGSININPYFQLGSIDYKEALQSENVSIVNNEETDHINAIKFTGKPGILYGDEELFLPYNKRYRMGIEVKIDINGETDPGKMIFYFGIANFDYDGEVIRPENLPQDEKPVLHTFTKPLRKGDTTLTIIGKKSDFYTGPWNHRRSFLLYKKQEDGAYRYIGKNGHVYDNLGMSKWTLYKGYDKHGIVEHSDGTVTFRLTEPYDGEEFEVGDGLVRTRGGAVFKYLIGRAMVDIDKEWHAVFRGWSTSRRTKNPARSIYTFNRNGTKYSRIVMIPNYKYIDKHKKSKPVPPNVNAYFNTIILEQKYM